MVLRAGTPIPPTLTGDGRDHYIRIDSAGFLRSGSDLALLSKVIVNPMSYG